SKLVRILKNNLRPEIRHEILNVDITCVSHLREVCRRRESFLEDVKRTNGYAKRMPFKRDIAEIQDDLVEVGQIFDSEVDVECEIGAIEFCWNCRQEGHRHMQCKQAKRVFSGPRPFVAVQLMEQLVKGLLDSGAAVSCLGGNLAQEFLQSSINFKKIAANVSTADGNKQEIVGKVRLPKVRRSRQKLISAIFRNSDNRLYTDISIADHQYVALLDSGAYISCIGGTAAQELGQHPKMRKCSGRIRTANNAECSVVGRLEFEVTYRGFT
ncbi:hypothetical protein KR084_012893, partial [Drosophila pseudotakahashii]